MKSTQLKKLVIEILDEYKAQDITSLKVDQLTDITDYMIICSGTSSRHVHSLSDHLITTIKKHHIRPLGVESEPLGTWTLVDLGDVIVHIMLPETREFYKLEKLWGITLAEEKRK